MAWTKMVSTALDDDQKMEMIGPISGLSDAPDYPYGMRICMDEALLERLDLDQDCDIGDLLDMRCFAKVTSVTKNQVNGEAKCRVELTIVEIALENESDENPEEEDD